MSCRAVTTVGWILLALAGVCAAEQWPQFRGPQAGVVPDDPALPDTWSETENVVWKTNIPGLGWSSPIVWNDHVFITSAISAGQEPAPIPGLYDRGDEYDRTRIQSSAQHRWVVYDVDFKTGAIRWARELHRAVPPGRRHVKNSHASETPVTDGERVYVYFGSIGLLAALNFNGQPIWTKDVGAFASHSDMGTASSPVLHQNRLYIVNDSHPRQSFIAAFDKRTGDEIWRVNREEHTNWSTPFVWENELRTEIVTAGSGKVRSYDLDGKLLWELTGMTGLNSPTPFGANGLLYLSSGYPAGALRPVYAIRPGASGDISLWRDQESNYTGFPGLRRSSEYIAWSYSLLGTYVTSALVYGDYYYTLLDRGLLVCHDARTGGEIYGRQRITAGTGFTASPWAYNGKIFLLSEDGDTYVIQPGPEFKVLGKNSLDEMPLATPAVARGSVIIRTQSHLYRIAKQS